MWFRVCMLPSIHGNQTYFSEQDYAQPLGNTLSNCVLGNYGPFKVNLTASQQELRFLHLKC